MTLAGTLRGVISQRLVSTRDGQGRVAAIEVMVVTGRIADRIADPNSEGATIQEQIAEGDYHGMQSFDQALRKLVLDKRISVQSALSASSSPHDLLVSLEAAGVPVRREAAGVA
jgi:twitching motility protein PilT